MSISDGIALLGGIALFLFGMSLMGDGLKKGSSDAFKRAMEKVTNNPLVGFLLGLVVTAVIQRSASFWARMSVRRSRARSFAFST